MAAVVFDKAEQDYLDWLKAHPSGFVLNVLRGAPEKCSMLHRSTCRTISEYGMAGGHQTAMGAFTHNTYIKVCADYVDELQDWLRDRRVNDFVNPRGPSGRCGQCKP
jgi:hypothetical protein